MKVVYTRHAKKRMKWRKISPTEIEAVLHRPDFEKPYSLNPEIVDAYKHIEGKYLRVSYKRQNNTYLIITVVDKND